MKLKLIIFALLISFQLGYTFAQNSFRLESITLSGGIQHALSKQEYVTSVNGLTGNVLLRFHLNKYIRIEGNFDYTYSKIYENNAIQNWDWAVYNDWYHNWVQTNDMGLTVIQIPKESMNSISTFLGLSIKLPFSFYNILPSITIGGGPSFLWRRLWLDESWSKTFNDAPQHTENFRTYATPEKMATTWQVLMGFELEYHLTKGIGIQVSANFSSIIKKNYNYDPQKNYVQILSGFIFYY